jgi:hypothetical protein
LGHALGGVGGIEANEWNAFVCVALADRRSGLVDDSLEPIERQKIGVVVDAELSLLRRRYDMGLADALHFFKTLG